MSKSGVLALMIVIVFFVLAGAGGGWVAHELWGKSRAPQPTPVGPDHASQDVPKLVRALLGLPKDVSLKDGSSKDICRALNGAYGGPGACDDLM